MNSGLKSVFGSLFKFQLKIPPFTGPADESEDVDRFIAEIKDSRAQHRQRASELTNFASVFIGILMIGFGYLVGTQPLEFFFIIPFLLSFAFFLITAALGIVSWHKSFAYLRWPSHDHLRDADFLEYRIADYDEIFNSLMRVAAFLKRASWAFCLGLLFLGFSAFLIFVTVIGSKPG